MNTNKMSAKIGMLTVCLTPLLLMAAAYADTDTKAETKVEPKKTYSLLGYGVSGEVDAGAELNTNDHKSSKYSEYRDIGNHALFGGKVGAEKNAYFLDFSASRIGLKDANYRLNGGDYSMFKYSLYLNEMVHNTTFNAKTIYDAKDIGTGNLGFGTISNYMGSAKSMNVPGYFNDPTLWNKFDYSLQTKTYGVDASYFRDGPFSLKLSVNQVKTDGIKALGASQGLAPDVSWVAASTTPMVELPEPVDYKTTNLNLIADYHGQNFLIAVDGLYSQFKNGIPTLTFQVPDEVQKAASSTFVLAPDSNTYRIAAHGVVHHLPLNSTLAVKGSLTKMTDSVKLQDTVTYTQTVASASTPPKINSYGVGANHSTFEGDIKYGSADVALTSNPVEKLDVKLFYDYLRRWNDNSDMQFNWLKPGAGALTYSTTALSSMLSYTKHKAGLDVDYALPFQTKFGVGYEYMTTHRAREDGMDTKNHTFFAQARNSAWDLLSVKLRYEHKIQETQAASDYFNYVDNSPQNIKGVKGIYVSRFVRMFDVASKRSDGVSSTLESSPIDDLDLSLSGSYRRNNYFASPAGRQSDNTTEGSFTASYLFPKSIKTSFFTDYAYTKYLYRNHLYKGYGSQDPSADPITDATAANYSYNFDQTQTEKNLSVGITVDVPITEKTTVSLGAQEEKSDGKLEFSQPIIPSVALNYAGSDSWDDSLRKTLTAKVKHQFTTNLSLTFTYMYESMKYSDASYDNYLNVSGPQIGSVSNNYFTGAYTDQNYSAHLAMAMLAYAF